jgi:CobQ-like glutamine amidotransferase family enzyme
MCFGAPSPQMKMEKPQGGSDMSAYTQQMQAQQQAFTQQLQQQIAAANQRASDLRIQFQQEQEALAADMAAQFAGAYNTTAQQTEAEGAQVTEAIKPKKDTSRNTLKINTGGAPAAAGAGVNLGV